MLNISPAVVNSFDAQTKDSLGNELAGHLRSLRLELPAPEQWRAWWNQTWDSAVALGATRKQTLFLHALFCCLHGPNYLLTPGFDWLRELVTDSGAHDPVYHLLEDVWPEVIQVVRDVYITDGAGVI